MSQSGQQWIIDAYAVALAALLLPFGALGDRFGRRLTLRAGVGILAASSAVASVSAAFAMPGTLSTITSVFPAESRAKAVGIWAGFAGAGGTMGRCCPACCSRSSGGARRSWPTPSSPGSPSC